MAVVQPPKLISLSSYTQSQKQDVSTHVSEIELPVLATRNSSRSDETAFLLPAGAYDTHVHVFDPRLGPYSPTRSYTPENASFASLTAFSQTLSAVSTAQAATFVLVQPSPYRTDNRVLLGLLKQCQCNGIVARGIAVVDVGSVTDDVLEHMHSLGVRGLRLNLQADGKEVDMKILESTVRVAAGRISHLPGWMLQIYAPSHVWTGLHNTVMSLPIPVIADHIGGLHGASKLPLELTNNPTQQAGFQSLISLAKASRIFIKISGLYRASDDSESNYSDMEPIIRKIASEVPDRLIWGSDWPHTGEGKDRAKSKDIEATEPFRVVNDLEVLKNLRKWIGCDEVWMKMMVDNARLAFG